MSADGDVDPDVVDEGTSLDEERKILGAMVGDDEAKSAVYAEHYQAHASESEIAEATGISKRSAGRRARKARRVMRDVD